MEKIEEALQSIDATLKRIEEKIDRKSTSQPSEKTFSELLRQSEEHPIALKFPKQILSKCLKKNE